MPRRKNRSYTIPGKLVASLILTAISISFFFLLLKVFFNRYPYFNISKVSIIGVDEGPYSSVRQKLIGKNIFTLDLSRLKKQIEQEAGDSECVAIERKLPAELRVSLRKRIAVAQVKFLRFHLVDGSGVLMPGASDVAFEGLPVIQGLAYTLQKANAKYYSLEEARKAIILIQEKNNLASLKEYTLLKITLAKQKTSTFILSENFLMKDLSKNVLAKAQVEVKFDPLKPVETIRVLGLLLSKRKLAAFSQGENKDSLGGIEYIDLTNTNTPIVLEKKAKDASR